MVNGPEDRDLLRSVRVIASVTILILIVVVVLLDRVGNIISGEYVALGDTALGLLLGALFALIGVQGVDFLRGK
jgi:hypothetical protein